MEHREVELLVQNHNEKAAELRFKPKQTDSKAWAVTYSALQSPERKSEKKRKILVMDLNETLDVI